MTTLARARRLWAMLRPPEARLLERPAGEREISVNRLVAGVLVLAYVAVLATLGLYSWSLTSVSIGYLAAGVAVFVDVRCRPHRSPPRRYASLCLDLGGLSVVLSQLTPYTLPLVSAYTWITLGYAFRYGIAYLRASSVLSLVGFSMVVATTPSWSAQPFLVAAVGGSLAVIPAYVEALLRKALGALERERASNRATAFVLACISHDLRTPLGAMITVTDLLSDTVLSPQQRAMLATVRASTRSILTDIDHLVEVSRIEADHLDVAKTEFALLPLLHEVMGLADAAARAKGVHLALYVSADTPLVIETDRRHLGKIALNLTHAAVEAGSAGSVLVTVDGGMLGRRPPHLRVAVADTNPSPHIAAEPFEAHPESDKEALVRRRPPGLGLSVAKHLVGLLGGRVGVEDDPDAGTTYRVEIPIQASRPPRPDLADAGVVLLSREPARVRTLAARLERLGAETFVLDRIDRLADVLARARGDLRTLAVAIDGRGVDPVAAALAIRRDPMFERVPLILFAAARGLPRPHVRRYYTTAIDDTSSEDELWTALQVVGPAAAEEENAMPIPSKTDPGAPPAAGSPLVLVADASRTGQVLLTQWLSQAGYCVRVVADGDAALDAFAGEDFDVALVDLDGPGMDGLDAVLLHRFTELSGKRHRLPIVGLVAEAGAQTARDRAGPALDACLAKPLDRTRLLETLAGLAHVRATPPLPDADEATIGPGVTPISSHPHFRAGFGPPPADEFDRLVADAGVGGAGRLADAFRDDATAVLDRLATAAIVGDAGDFRAQLDILRASADAISAARVEALCRSGATIEAAALPDRGKALVAHLAQEVQRVCVTLEGRC